MPKILLCDDNHRHLAAGRAQLGENQVVALDSYEEAIEHLKEGSDIDVVLSDLMMPGEPRTLGPEGMKYIGQSIPIGFVLALRAAKVGVPLVAVVTDTNHHDHPMSAAIDWLNPAYWNGDQTTCFTIEASRVLIAHAPITEDGTKDWAKVLTALCKS